MEIVLRPSFAKDFKRLEKNIRIKFIERKRVFSTEPFNSVLNNHSLHGKYQGCRSINVTGDYRAIFYLRNDICVFIRIGTHTQLYG